MQYNSYIFKSMCMVYGVLTLIYYKHSCIMFISKFRKCTPKAMGKSRLQQKRICKVGCRKAREKDNIGQETINLSLTQISESNSTQSLIKRRLRGNIKRRKKECEEKKMNRFKKTLKKSINNVHLRELVRKICKNTESKLIRNQKEKR